jgi:hypothetical protein
VPADAQRASLDAQRASLDALRAMHDEVWDPAALMVRAPSGMAPGTDLAALGLHAVRETALGAFLDLGDGRVERAVAALERVLEMQYRAPGRPWQGTFRVMAEEHAPPGDRAREWIHYDPNWRQFLGCILALTVERHGSALPVSLMAAIGDAVTGCVAGELPGRIAPWYTNPNLMHAWMTAWLGRRLDDGELIRAGEDRLQSIMRRLDRYGDVDEYNSPTYDGIDLFAAGLWSAIPPTDLFGIAGTRLAGQLGARLGRLYHPGLGAIAGPYLRAYGLSLDRYVSLAGQWLLLAGAGSRALPAHLGGDTVHVHDLYFLPLLDALAGAVVPHLRLDPVDRARDHEQRFDGTVAMSRLDRAWAIGGERGRRPEFARDQYFPFTAHYRDVGETACVGLKAGDRTDAVDAGLGGGSDATIRARGREVVELVMFWSEAPEQEGPVFRLGPLALDAGVVPTEVVRRVRPTGIEVRAVWSTAEVVIESRLAAPGQDGQM